MRYLRWILWALLFLLLLGLAIKNSDTVALRYLLGWEWKAPLSLVLFVFFVAGVIVGSLAGIGQFYRLRRELVQLKRSVSAGESQREPADIAPERRLL
jgi:uncharacterized integral membrane protein